MKQMLDKLTKEKLSVCPRFFSVINEELTRVEEKLNLNAPGNNPLLKEIVSYILKAGGKRFRPAVCLLVAKATGNITEKHIILAELTELIHTASLIHDDIIDSSKLRRGIETINSLWNDKISVITGDFLFAQASIRLGELEQTEIVKIYAEVLSDLCNGEIEQYSSSFNTNITWEKYIQKSTTKTASLFAACCKSSAILNNQNIKIIRQTEAYGKSIGIAFQIIDDILDFTSTSKEIGKEVGADLKQGIITAPTIFALESTDERREQLRNLIENSLIENRLNNNNENDFDRAIRLIHELGGCEKAKLLAEEYINKAKENISFTEDLELENYLSTTADYILNRC